MEMYEVYDKNAGPDDIAIDHLFTEQGALAEIVKQAKKGRDCAYRMFTPRCTWGNAYNETRCKNEATWFDPKWGTCSAVCDEHNKYGKERRVRADKAARIELGQGKPPVEQSRMGQASFWFDLRGLDGEGN